MPDLKRQPSQLEHETPALIARLQDALTDRQQYKRLLGQRGSEAQQLLDLFQRLLDVSYQDGSFQGKLIVTSQRLSKKSGLFPSCYELKGIKQDGEHPVQAGGFADIYRGEFHGQKLCLKVLRIYQNTKNEEILKRLSKEAILWGQLSHPNLLPFYGLYRFKTRICLVSPWMEFGEVGKYLKANPDAHRLPLALDVAQGLLYLHRNGAVHGDIKGPNVLVNGAGRACLTDFGISSVPNSGIIELTSDSAPASVGGSIRWQAPELFGAETESEEVAQNTVETDVYAWASLCYEMFTGELPFSNITNEYAIMFKIKSGQRPTRPSDSSPAWSEWGLTESIWSLLERCWDADPAERPSIKQVIGELRRISVHGSQDPRPSASGSVLSPARFRKSMRKSPTDVISISTLDLLLSPPNEDDDNSPSLAAEGKDDVDDADEDMEEEPPDGDQNVSLSADTPFGSPASESPASTIPMKKRLSSSGEFKCQLCDASFTRPQNVRRHMRLHTRNRPHKCRLCNKRFAASDSLSQHVTDAHPEAPVSGSTPPGEKLVLKSACNPCAQSGLSCNGYHPCNTCVQRKCHCSFDVSRKALIPSIPLTASPELAKQSLHGFPGTTEDSIIISHPKLRTHHKRHSSQPQPQQQQRRPTSRPSSVILDLPESPHPQRSKSEGSHFQTTPKSPPRTPKPLAAAGGGGSPRLRKRELKAESDGLGLSPAFKRTSLIDLTIHEESQQQPRPSSAGHNRETKGMFDGSLLMRRSDSGNRIGVEERVNGDDDDHNDDDDDGAMRGSRDLRGLPPRARRPLSGSKFTLHQA